MCFLRLLFYHDLPKDFLSLYGNCISRRKRLKNGWFAVKLKNDMLFLIHKQYPSLSFSSAKKVTEAKDGKFMIENKNRDVVIYSPLGEQLTPFNKYSKLYPNGWYSLGNGEDISLYNNEGKCVGEHLRYAKVFKNGTYLMSITSRGNACHAGIFNAKGERLYFTNTQKAHVLSNGWFVVEGSLCDNSGNIFLSPLPTRRVPDWLLILFGSCMKAKSL